MPVDRERLRSLLEREKATFTSENPQSKQLFESADSLFGKVPLTWMAKAHGGFPLYLSKASGNRIVSVDGKEYIDFSLGDTAAMAGHSPGPTIEAIVQRLTVDGGLSTMLPTADAANVGAELRRRFKLPLWSFTLTATDANRWAIRLARLATGRPKILVFAYCYHGSVDEIFAVVGEGGRAVSRPGNVGPPCDLAITTRVVEFNDLEALKRELSHGDVAAVLTEPAMTNIGMVLPQPGFMEGLRAACDESGTLLIIDETHTWSAGPGGATTAWNLRPDIFTIGKAIGGGMPSGAYGISMDVARRIGVHTEKGEADIIDVGGVGGTLAGNALSVAAMRATLEKALTDDVWASGTELATAFREGLEKHIALHGLPWSVTQLGTRVEYRFTSPAPVNGSQAAAASDEELEAYLHVYAANRGVLITPFHTMALMCRATSRADVDRHTEVFGEALAELCGKKEEG
jgi:glutamate-1-semialdehyde 2,1-aminomutase